MPAPGECVGVFLFSCCVLALQPAQGQESNCSCNVSNSRCDDIGECRCDPGWEGERCDVCVRMPGCVHGSCHQPWQCSCLPGWAGRFCDKDIYVCSKEEPCQNGATCVTEDSGDYSCLCPDGFHGRNCQLKTGPCFQRRSPCKNGGLCEDDSGFASELRCRCLAGFTGPRCETDLDDCLLQPCANGATCLDSVNRFSCLCPEGFTGRFCTINLDDCASQPCRNGGRCLDRAGTFQCLCQSGYRGRTCEAASPPPIWTSQGWEGGGESGGGGRRVNQSVSGNNSQSTGVGGTASGQTSGDAHRPFKISVKEVVTQQGSTALSEVQLITLLVLGGMTLAVVLLTAGLVLKVHWQDRGIPCNHGNLSPRQPERRRAEAMQSDENQTVVTEQECKISFLDTPTGEEPQRKRQNNAVI